MGLTLGVAKRALSAFPGSARQTGARAGWIWLFEWANAGL